MEWDATHVYVDWSVLPDILKALQSLETSGIEYAMTLHHHPEAWTFGNTAVRNSNLKQMKLDYASKLKHYRWCMWARIKFTWQLWEYRLTTNIWVVLKQYMHMDSQRWQNSVEFILCSELNSLMKYNSYLPIFFLIFISDFWKPGDTKPLWRWHTLPVCTSMTWPSLR